MQNALKSFLSAARLPIGWVLSGHFPLSQSSAFMSTGVKFVVEPTCDLAEQIRLWYEKESFGALKQVDPRSAADHRAIEIFDKPTFLRTIVIM